MRTFPSTDGGETIETGLPRRRIGKLMVETLEVIGRPLERGRPLRPRRVTCGVSKVSEGKASETSVIETKLKSLERTDVLSTISIKVNLLWYIIKHVNKDYPLKLI